MTATAISDIVVPEVWAPEVERMRTEVSQIIQSGIAATHPQITAQLNSGGQSINVPYMNPLTGDSEVITSGTDLTVNAQTGSSQLAIRLMRAKAWGWEDVVGWVQQGMDLPEAALSNIARWWQVDEQTTLMSVLTGIFTTALASSHVYDYSGTGTLNATAIMNATKLLGDNRQNIVGLMCHSKVAADLEIADLVTALRDSESNTSFSMYMNRFRIIEDDDCPVTTGSPDTYRSYLFGAGSIAYGRAAIAPRQAIEPFRDELASTDVLAVRSNHIIHPVGLTYAGAVASGGPSNTTLEAGASWTQVFPDKLIRIIAIDSQ